MRKFLLKIGFLTTLLVSGYLISIYKITKGNVDFNYAKFTHKANSLIIGLSRAHYGVNPEVIENEFKNNINTPVLNFAFEKLQSPYGDVLLKSIKKKIDTNSNNGLFILSVNPGSFLISKSLKHDLSTIDNNTILSKMTRFNSHPNFEYIRKCYETPLYLGLIKPTNSKKEFHPNGWAEYKSNKYNLTEKTIKRRKEFIKKKQTKFLSNEETSEYRIDKFKEIVSFLKKYGQVVIIRTPCDSEVISMENTLFPSFNSTIESLSTLYNVPYFNYTNPKHSIYKTFDGTHLISKSANKFTKDLCQDIKKYQQQ